MEWQPIETAPKDGTRVLATWDITWVRGNPHVEVCECGERGEWFYTYDGDCPKRPPTHWMPLPEPPLQLSESEVEQPGRSDNEGGLRD